jgi:hypothetical protein
MITLAYWASQVDLMQFYERFVRCCGASTRRGGLRYVNKWRRKMGLPLCDVSRAAQERFAERASKKGWSVRA